MRRSVLLALGIAALATACTSDPPDGPVDEGSRAPGFALPSVDGSTVRLQNFLGDRAVLLYFSMGPG